MKYSKFYLIVFLISLFALSSCTVRLVDYTIIGTKNLQIGMDKSLGKQTEGSKSYFFGFGWNLKDAIDDALQNAGPSYDILIDGVVEYTDYPFVLVISVRGVALDSRKLKASLGEKGFEDWCNQNNILDPSTIQK